MKLGLSLLIASLTLTITVVRAEPAQQNEPLAREIFSETMSPFCPGRLLSDCPSSAAHELQQEIRNRLSKGDSKETILDYLYTLYGEEVRAAPKNAGFGRAAWLATPIFILLGLGLIFAWIKSQKRSASETSINKIDPKIKKRIEQELADS